MASKRLNAEQADDVLSGRRPARRGAPEGVEHVVAVLHASRELEPPPPMSEELHAAVYGLQPRSGQPPPARPEGDEVAPAVTLEARPRSARRAVASLAAAAAVLVGVVLAATLPEGKAGRSDMGDTPGAEPRSDSTSSRPAAAAKGIGRPAPAEPVTPPETAAEPAAEPTPSTGGASAPDATQAPAAPPAGDGSGDRRGDGDSDGDRDGRWSDHSHDGEVAPDTTGQDPPTSETTSSSTTSTTTPGSSTTSTTQGEPGSTTTTTGAPRPDDWWWWWHVTDRDDRFGGR